MHISSTMPVVTRSQSRRAEAAKLTVPVAVQTVRPTYYEVIREIRGYCNKFLTTNGLSPTNRVNHKVNVAIALYNYVLENLDQLIQAASTLPSACNNLFCIYIRAILMRKDIDNLKQRPENATKLLTVLDKVQTQIHKWLNFE